MSRSIEIIEAGIQTTVQDYPGRRGMQALGFFPAGPVDHLAHRAANLVVGNDVSAATFEVTLGGFAIRIGADATVAVCGAPVDVSAGGEPLPLWEGRRVAAGSELRVGITPGPGFRVYVAVSGGLDVPALFGSRATYTMGALGGHEGRALASGDVLPLGDDTGDGVARRFRADARPAYAREWEIEVVRGPHADPDFLAAADVDQLLSRSWKVDRNSNRTGIRLEPASFAWARTTGGIAGGHPSNILDNPYPVGAVNVNGDLPVILGPDGPTAGGFVCPLTIAHAGFWKVGQLRPVGDTVRFREVSLDEAIELDRALDASLTAASLETV